LQYGSGSIIDIPRKRNKKLKETIANKGSRPIFYRFGLGFIVYLLMSKLL
jgi:hypothetical protein